MDFKINDIVIVDGKYECQIIDIVEENNITWYEVSPLEFKSFTRHVTIDNLTKQSH